MKLFDPEGPLMSALAKLSDVVFCNIMFCLCSLPVVTIGAALSALYECTMSIVEDTEKPQIFRQFWTSFKKNLRQGTVLWLIFLGGALVLIAYGFAVGAMGGELSRIYRIFLYLLVFLYLAGFAYVFPVQGNMDLPVREVLKTAWLLSAVALPYTLLILAVTGAAVYISFFTGPDTLYASIFLWAVIIFGLVAYLQSFLLRLAFKRWRRLRGEREPEEMPDPWETGNSEGSDHESKV